MIDVFAKETHFTYRRRTRWSLGVELSDSGILFLGRSKRGRASGGAGYRAVQELAREHDGDTPLKQRPESASVTYYRFVEERKRAYVPTYLPWFLNNKKTLLFTLRTYPYRRMVTRREKRLRHHHDNKIR